MKQLKLFFSKKRNIVLFILLGYLTFVIVSLTLLAELTSIPKRESQTVEYKETDEQVALVESGEEAWQVRRELIENAEETIDISTFSTNSGETSELFYSLLLEAADRGVSVRLLLDGIFHGMRFLERNVYDLFLDHPNVEVGLYETLNLAQPWTWNNRMHDKLMIADNRAGLIGGRNIEDKYFNETGTGLSYDREVLVFQEEALEDSIVSNMKKYYQELWDQPVVTKRDQPVPTLTTDYRLSRTRERLTERAINYRSQSIFLEGREYWIEKAHPIEEGAFVHNGLSPYKKEPLVWEELLNQSEQAEEEIVIQTPYYIPDEFMRETIGQHAIEPENVTILTNGLNATPNYLGHSGYRNHRERLINRDVTLQEYQNEDSSLHMKSFIIDSEIVGVGSFNIDARSAYWHTESMVILYSEGLAEEIEFAVNDRYGSDIYTVNEGHEGESDVSSIKRFIIEGLRPIVRLFENQL